MGARSERLPIQESDGRCRRVAGGRQGSQGGSRSQEEERIRRDGRSLSCTARQVRICFCAQGLSSHAQPHSHPRWPLGPLGHRDAHVPARHLQRAARPYLTKQFSPKQQPQKDPIAPGATRSRHSRPRQASWLLRLDPLPGGATRDPVQVCAPRGDPRLPRRRRGATLLKARRRPCTGHVEADSALRDDLSSARRRRRQRERRRRTQAAQRQLAARAGAPARHRRGRSQDGRVDIHERLG